MSTPDNLPGASAINAGRRVALRSPELLRHMSNPLVESVSDNYASQFHKRLRKWIRDFDDSLDDDHEVGIRLVSFGQTMTFHLIDMGYSNPSLISFSGVTDGNPVELIQHVSQISILLMKLPRRDASEPKRPFGFHARPDEA